MATLEKIRSKSVLLFVIIIVALLAFILGDFLTSGRTYFARAQQWLKPPAHKWTTQPIRTACRSSASSIRHKAVSSTTTA